MMHWKATLLVLGLFFGTLTLQGCSQPCCLRDCDDFFQRADLPPDLASNPDYDKKRVTPDISRPADVNDLDRDPTYITLSECIAMALEKGTAGTLSAQRFFSGNANLSNLFNTADDLSFFNGSSLGAVDAIRVFALVPAVQFTDTESALARYDVVLRSIVGMNTKDQNPLGPNAFASGQFGALGFTAAKGLATGGEVDVTFGSPTTNGSNPGTNFVNNFATRNFFSGSINPSYTPNLTFNYTQPLLRGFGTYINSLLPQHPLSPQQQLPGSPTASAPPILIARLNFDESRAEFERVVNYMVLNVEASYFQLYALYVNLYSTEQALRQAHATWKISKAKYEAGSIPNTQFAITRAQYEDFRDKRLQALSKVLEQERELRLLIGLPLEDGKRLVPVDTPTIQEYKPNWETAQQEAMTLRPELAIARKDIERRQLELVRERNNLLPDVRLEASYNIHAFGTRLDGDGTFAGGQTDNAFRDLMGMHFADYNVGLTASMPLGFRAQYAALRAANLKLAQAYLSLRHQENLAQNNLAVAYRLVISDYGRISILRAKREASAEQVEGRFKEFVAGKITVDFLLTAQQQWADAVAQEYQAIANYNTDLALFQFAKGTLLKHNGIDIAEGALPQCVQVRAVEHERQRAAALACRDHAAVVPQTGDCCLPALDASSAPSLPAMMMDTKDRIPSELNDPLPPTTSSHSPATTTSAGPDFSAPPVLNMPTGPAAMPMPNRRN